MAKKITTILTESYNDTSKLLTEATVEKNDLANFKIHIPLIVTSDLPKNLVRVLANTQQIKIANQLLKTLQKAGSKMFKGTDQQIMDRLKECTDIAQSDLLKEESIHYHKHEAKQDPEPDTQDKIIKIGKVISGVASAATAVVGVGLAAKKMMEKTPPKGKEEKNGSSFGIDSKDMIGGEGVLFSSPYTEIEIQSGGLLKRLFGNSKYTIAIKVYVVSVSVDEFSANLDAMESKIAKVSTTPSLNKDSKNIMATPLTKGSFGQVITDEMIKDRAWGEVIGGKKYGCSLALSQLAVEELRYGKLDLSYPSDVKKLVKLLNVFDLFIIKTDTEEVDYLDPDTFKFDTIPFGVLKVGNPNRRKVTLAID